ncbi:MAG TPA: hypothetical protein VGM84_16830 [Steroidobacteraceae bacterium]|jgi:hypothetical protein
MSQSKSFANTACRAALMLGITCCAAPGIASASEVTYLVTGSVTNVTNVGGALPTSLENVADGTSFTLAFTEDTSISPQAGGTANAAVYLGAITQASFQIGGTTALQGTAADLTVLADLFNSAASTYSTQFAFGTETGDLSGVTGVVARGVLFQNITSSAPLGLYQTALTIPGPLPLSADNMFLQLNYTDYVNGVATSDKVGAIVANVTSIAPVPLPASAWLLLSGVVAALCVRGAAVGAGLGSPAAGRPALS